MKRSTRPVVVGVADKQPTVIRLAVQEAIRAGAPLRVVHAASVPHHDVATYVGDHEFEDIKAAGQKVLDDAKELVDQHAAPAEVRYVLTIASAVETLEHLSYDARLLVIGADGIPWHDRERDSGVIRHLARHAPCPVIVVPEPARAVPPAAAVVAALDGDTSVIGPLTYAMEQARAREQELHLLHAVSPATLATDAEEIRAGIDEVLARFALTHPEVRVTRAFVVDGTEQAILRAGDRAELVVVGRSRSRNLSFALTRPIATEVLRRAGCPVVIVPPDYQGTSG